MVCKTWSLQEADWRQINNQECKYQDRRAEPQVIQIYLNFIDFYFFFSWAEDVDHYI